MSERHSTEKETNDKEQKPKKPETVSRQLYEKHLLRAKAASSYFLYVRYYAKITTKLSALFLQDLINLSALDNAVTEEIDGKRFFQCTKNFLINSAIGWTEDEQKYHFDILMEKGFIELIRHGSRGTRWAYIDFVEIEKALDNWLNQSGGKPPVSEISQGENPPSQSGGKPPVKKQQQIKKQCPPSSDGDDNFVLYREDINTFAKNLASLLFTRCLKLGVLGVNQPSSTQSGEDVVKRWMKDYCSSRFHRTKTYSDAVILKVMEGHLPNIGKQYWPEAFSMDAFCRKFDEIKRKVDKLEAKNGSGSTNLDFETREEWIC